VHSPVAVKAVLFDLYNTIARFEPSREELQIQAAAEFGLSVTADGVARGYHAADAYFAGRVSATPIRGMSPGEQERFFSRYEQLILQGAGCEVDAATALRVWERIRREDYGMRLFDDVIPAFDALRSGCMIVGVISNYDRAGSEIADDLGLTGHVDFVVTSREAGAQKPDPPIFEMALARSGTDASDTVLVGDQLESDVVGALNVGIRPVLMDRYGDHPGYDEHPRIERLDELPSILAGM